MTIRVVPLLQAVLLLGTGLTTEWGVTAWIVATGATVVLDGFVVIWMRRYHADRLAPADMVTITRATLTCAVAALVVTSLPAGELLDSSPTAAVITALAAVSLALDLVDGWVARGTGHETAFGARFDGEADAALMLVLSIWIAPALGWWVLPIGLARYAFGVAGWVLPWLRRQLPPRYWRKVVTAVTSVVLVGAASARVPSPLVEVAVLIGLVLVVESFGRDIGWLWRHRAHPEGAPADETHPDETRPGDFLQRARRDAYGANEFVDQQGFMRAGEIRTLAAVAGISSGTRVLDLCCGRGGPGRMIARETGCDLLGMDTSESAVREARAQAAALACRYEVGQVPELPTGQWDVVLLLETMLAFHDKETLLHRIRSVLVPGGRLAFTVEEGDLLTPRERAMMPAADTVWPIPWWRLREVLDRAGFEVIWHQDRSHAHAEVVDALVHELTGGASAIREEIGREHLEHLLTSHRLWRDWLRSGRIRKFAVVATARAGSGRTPQPGHRSDSP